MRSSSPFEIVRCPGCNEPRRISSRQARRGVTYCRACRYPPNMKEPTAADMRWWLNHFNDVELASIATDLVGKIISPEGISKQRQILTGSGGKEDE